MRCGEVHGKQASERQTEASIHDCHGHLLICYQRERIQVRRQHAQGKGRRLIPGFPTKTVPKTDPDFQQPRLKSPKTPIDPEHAKPRPGRGETTPPRQEHWARSPAQQIGRRPHDLRAIPITTNYHACYCNYCCCCFCLLLLVSLLHMCCCYCYS